jgi:hypothetical protein
MEETEPRTPPRRHRGRAPLEHTQLSSLNNLSQQPSRRTMHASGQSSSPEPGSEDLGAFVRPSTNAVPLTMVLLSLGSRPIDSSVSVNPPTACGISAISDCPQAPASRITNSCPTLGWHLTSKARQATWHHGTMKSITPEAGAPTTNNHQPAPSRLFSRCWWQPDRSSPIKVSDPDIAR